jgi:CSLREA domain-containing protein
LADNTTQDSVLTLREAIQVVDGNLGRSLSSKEQAQITGTVGTNDTIQFNLPAGSQTITLTGGALPITKAVAISGPGSGILTINGNNHDRVFYVGQGFSQKLSLVASITGLTISGGNQGYGGGLFNSGTLTVSNTTFSQNTANTNGGGGIYNNGVLNVSNSTFSGNVTNGNGSGSTAGGGLLNLSAGTVTLTNCVFSGNTAPGSGSHAGSGAAISNSGTMTVNNGMFLSNTAASDGGAIYNNGTLTANNSTFQSNTAQSDGGAIRSSTTLTLSGCTLSGNTASSEGGAVDGTSSAKLVVTNTTFVNNTAGSRGGALKIQGTTFSLTNTTITGNRVTLGSGGAYGGGLYDSSTAVLHNTIVAGNFQGPASSTTANDIYGNVDSTSSFNLIGTGGSGGLVNGANNNQVGVSAPRLGGLANNGGPTQTVSLLPGSPAIDRGSNAFVTAGETDQRGLARTVNGTVDLGALEVQTTSKPPSDQTAMAGTATAFNLGSFTDANSAGGPWTASVNWGDGSASTTFTSITQGNLGVQSHTYQTAGTVTVTVTITDVNHDSSTAASHVTVGGLAQVVSSLAVTGFPSPATQGVAGTFTVTAKDSSGTTVTGYTGTVHFTSSDPRASLPADYTFVTSDNGSHAFSATLQTTGTQSLTATAGVTGTQTGITVNPANAPAILTVNSLADNTAPDNDLTLREAIQLEDGTLGRSLTTGEQAQIYGTLGNADTIQFNLPAGQQTITLTGGALSITHPLTIAGPGAGALTIDGNNQDRVFVVGQIFSRNLSLVVGISGLTISGGNQTYGAGLLNFGTLTVSNTNFANNTAGASGGGGIYNVGALTLSSCTFSGNAVSNLGAGAGLENISSGTVNLTNCVFIANSAGGSGANASSGAGIANSGSMTVSNSTFSSNSAASDGGAIYNDGTLTISTTTFSNNAVLADGGAIRSGGVLTISSSTFSGNSAASVGGALDSSDTTLLVTNCTFANNTAVSMGGAIQADSGSGTATLINDTITGNSVTIGSGGVFGGGLFSGRPATLDNTIVAGNFQGAAPGTASSDIVGTEDPSSSFNLIGTGGSGGLVDGVNNNQVGVSNPGLGTLANNGGPTFTVALLSGSPAIDQGSNAFVSSGETDQRGLSRIVNGTVDIGAFELQ